MSRPPPASKIFLVGFMGVGKTTLGRMLADRLGWTFLDLDALIEDSAGASISTIFETKGEAAFRALERDALSRVAGLPERMVVACGGGVFCSSENQALMNRQGVAVWLDQPFDQIWRRRSMLAPSRPLMGGEAELRRLYEERTPHYRRASARMIVPEGNWAEALDALMGLLKERGEL